MYPSSNFEKRGRTRAIKSIFFHIVHLILYQFSFTREVIPRSSFLNAATYIVWTQWKGWWHTLLSLFFSFSHLGPKTPSSRPDPWSKAPINERTKELWSRLKRNFFSKLTSHERFCTRAGSPWTLQLGGAKHALLKKKKRKAESRNQDARKRFGSGRVFIPTALRVAYRNTNIASAVRMCFSRNEIMT